ncbi:YeiH family protein [Thioclava sp. GXIMD4215]|uniref:YeiH family protein n=1 Tax=Thioclava sp. GXIMD4215 TaxID=3131928 RepID=UPI00324CF729
MIAPAPRTHIPALLRRRVLTLRTALPGLALCAALAALAFAAHHLAGISALSPLILAILLGMALNTMHPLPPCFAPGIAFSLRYVLRGGIVLLGLQLTFGQVLSVGVSGLALILVTLLATFAFTRWLGRRMGLPAGLTDLIAAGSSICGASAVIAANTVTRARDEDVAYAIACVTIFGSASMALMPLAAPLLSLGPKAYGLWTGASIHEVAQVVAAAFQQGDQAGHFGTIAKLTRVMMLAPMVLLLGLSSRNRPKKGESLGRAPLPWFVFGFIAMVGLASTGLVPAPMRDTSTTLTQILLSVALAAMGLSTDLRKLVAAGLRPAILGAAAWVFISGLSLLLVCLTQ